ncbi:MAG: ornithine carbamoyltransferase [Deltaproteobacteria bacterium RBG_13_65_10]|nr:MAG: ornithine carbamoyltransferase [Deltaproteobacteria bacterium RBG_13_65_10]
MGPEWGAIEGGRNSLKDLISIADLSEDEVRGILDRAAELKAMHKRGVLHQPLRSKTLGMFFEKPSLRTRVTFEVGMSHLGGHAILLTPEHIAIGVRETVADVARNLERWVDLVVARTFSHQLVVDLAKYASIPVINGLTDLLHPCQILADIFTLVERFKDVNGVKVAYLGDGNNVANSWINGAVKTGIDLTLAVPDGYEPHASVLAAARAYGKPGGRKIRVLHDPHEAVADADVIYTDVWASMGQEAEREERIKIFRPYQVNRDLVSKAKPRALIMHCLPAHRGEEITDEVLDGPNSIVFDEAENRLHVQKAVMEILAAGAIGRGSR